VFEVIMAMFLWRFRLVLTIVCLLLSGCGSDEVRGRVVGKVTFQGQPVAEGIVVFANDQKGVHMTADIKPDGSYQIITAKGAGLPLGGYTVSVCPPLPQVTTGTFGKPPAKKPYPNIPAKYRNPKTAGLTLTVAKGENTFDIDMTP